MEAIISADCDYTMRLRGVDCAACTRLRTYFQRVCRIAAVKTPSPQIAAQTVLYLYSRDRNQADGIVPRFCIVQRRYVIALSDTCNPRKRRHIR